MLLGGLRAGRRSGLPTVALVHSLRAFFTGPWPHGPIGAAATLRGLRPAKIWADLTGAVTVCLPELVGSETALGGPVVGPVWPGTPRPPSRSGRPRVLIGLSTFPRPGMDAVAARILEADSASDVEVVFTTGPSLDPAQLSVPRNVEVHRFVDHGLLMPDVDVMITHGGHGTAMRALAHDLPLLMLPLHPICASPCAPCPPASTLSNPACDRSTREDGVRPTSRTDGRPTRGTDRHKPPRPQVTNQRSDPRPVVSALAVGARTDPADDPTGVTAARCARWSTGCATRGVGTRATGTPGSCSTPATTVPGWRSCLPTYPCSSSPGCGRTGRGCGRFPSAVPDHRIGGPATARR